MKEFLKQYAAYNVWADQRVIETLRGLPPEKWTTEVPSSFRSLFLTLFHMWNASSIWWQRLKLQERIVAPSEEPNRSMEDIFASLQQSDQQWLEWISNASDASVDHVFQYYNSKKEYFKQPAWHVLVHVINHNTYHRGQIVNMLRQLGEEKIPGLDFSIYCTRKLNR